MSDEPKPAPETTTPAGEAPKPEPSDMITIDDFLRVKLRVGKVLSAEAHPNADKLLVLKVDLGDEQRQVCAGLRAYYAPEDLIGKNLILVANLAPRRMRGLESQGMLLAASSPDKQQVIILTTDAEIPPGSSVS